MLSNNQLNKRILSVIVFTFFCYISVGLPLVLPGFVKNHPGFSSFIAGLIISIQYFATLLSRPQLCRLADRLGPKRVVTILAAFMRHWPWLSLALLALVRLFLEGVKASAAPALRCGA